MTWWKYFASSPFLPFLLLCEPSGGSHGGCLDVLGPECVQSNCERMLIKIPVSLRREILWWRWRPTFEFVCIHLSNCAAKIFYLELNSKYTFHLLLQYTNAFKHKHSEFYSNNNENLSRSYLMHLKSEYFTSLSLLLGGSWAEPLMQGSTINNFH